VMGSAGRQGERPKVYAQLNEVDSDSDELDECSAVEHDSGSCFCRFWNPCSTEESEYSRRVGVPVHGRWRDGTVRKVLEGWTMFWRLIDGVREQKKCLSSVMDFVS